MKKMSSLRKRPPGLLGDRRGSVFVELVAAFPFFAALGLLGVYAFGFYVEVGASQRHVRSCAWRYAASGCRALPPGCELSGRGQVDDGGLRTAARGAFERIGSRLRFLAPTLASLHGDWFEIAQARTVRRPVQLGGAVAIEARYRALCDTRVEEWRTPAVFEATCLTLGLFCP